ncbi:nucleotidyltransferase domain-containing protein [Anaerobranca gottschalkii]|uniref:Nucleotidyltransferase domain-containing protein n=1 Tax=Anaerobranca gottschalkii DSM 13577 TaxID=1120990 RepID=A0A1I0A034_9FIRM|nr:nucleotidyltransferase domain-containing protein [Anaerobranca gottschalkii]SES87281.1 Nucleotidyltransferase domain-containing protein [Anaerobranca gottschalkii DSM 13577]
MKFGISKKSMDLIVNTIYKFPDIDKAVVFGSRSKGNYKRGSDIDVAVFGKEISDNTVNRLRVILNEELPLPFYFDVINFETLQNEELKREIENYGVVIYQK